MWTKTTSRTMQNKVKRTKIQLNKTDQSLSQKELDVSITFQTRSCKSSTSEQQQEGSKQKCDIHWHFHKEN